MQDELRLWELSWPESRRLLVNHVSNLRLKALYELVDQENRSEWTAEKSK